jgi:hypothetical protein
MASKVARRAHLACQRALHQHGRLRGALDMVDMRVGAIGDQRACIVRHRLGHVGVQIQGRHHGHARADARADALQQIALAVILVLRDNGAVERQ